MTWYTVNGVVSCSLPAFGKRFTPDFQNMGGKKRKSRNGVIYAGIDLASDTQRKACPHLSRIQDLVSQSVTDRPPSAFVSYKAG
jgi:hypothetical protein